MKKNEMDWKQFKLTDEILWTLAITFFEERDWHDVTSGGARDYGFIAELLASYDIISQEQKDVYFAIKEWTRE